MWPSSPRRGQLLSLLQASFHGRRDLRVATFDDAQIRWAIETGIGPLLVYATTADPQAATSPLWACLQGADLVARMLTCEQFDATLELIDACEGRAPPLTLLKGISISEQYYPEPHLRRMRDIDVLVEEAALPAVESVLFTLGYRQQSHYPPAFYATHHHSMPFVHPQRGVWVEVHRGLFPSTSHMGADWVFSREHLQSQLRPSSFQGRKVTRLSEALQLVYIASHWAFEFQAIGGMAAMLDLIYLLKQAKDTICWAQILEWLDGSAAAPPLYLLLTYLKRAHLVDIASALLTDLFHRQRAFGTLNLTLMHTLLDRYTVGGHAFGRVCSGHHLNILWKTLLLPGPPVGNLLRIPWNLFLDSRVRTGFSRLQSMLKRIGDTGTRDAPPSQGDR